MSGFFPILISKLTNWKISRQIGKKQQIGKKPQLQKETPQVKAHHEVSQNFHQMSFQSPVIFSSVPKQNKFPVQTFFGKLTSVDFGEKSADKNRKY